MSEDKPQKEASAGGRVTIELAEPITFNKVTHSVLTFRKRKVRDLVAADRVKGLVNKEAAVLASMADVPLPVITELDADDYDTVMAETAPLMGKSWETVKMGWLTEMALDEGVASGIQAELASKRETRSPSSD